MKPLISIITAVYNTDRFLSKCLESALAQTLKDFEILLFNDGSTDSSAEICNHFALKDNRIQFFNSKKNVGVSTIRNKALQMARGEYIFFLDSDDWIDENALETLYTTMQNDGSDLVVCGYMEEFNHTSQPWFDKAKPGYYTGAEGLKLAFSGLISSTLCNKFYKRKIAKREFPIGRHYEDHATIFEWIASCQKISIIRKTPYHYRQHGNSITHLGDNAASQYDLFRAEEDRYLFAVKNGMKDIGLHALVKMGKNTIRCINLGSSSFNDKRHYSQLIGERLKSEKTANKKYLNAKNRLRLRLLWTSPTFFVAYQRLLKPFRKDVIKKVHKK